MYRMQTRLLTYIHTSTTKKLFSSIPRQLCKTNKTKYIDSENFVYDISLASE